MMGVDETDIWVMLKPRDQWPDVRSPKNSVEEMESKLLKRVPGAEFLVHAADRNARATSWSPA